MHISKFYIKKTGQEQHHKRAPWQKNPALLTVFWFIFGCCVLNSLYDLEHLLQGLWIKENIFQSIASH